MLLLGFLSFLRYFVVMSLRASEALLVLKLLGMKLLRKFCMPPRMSSLAFTLLLILLRLVPLSVVTALDSGPPPKLAH